MFNLFSFHFSDECLLCVFFSYFLNGFPNVVYFANDAEHK